MVSPVCAGGNFRRGSSTRATGLDVSTGTGEAALVALQAVGASGVVIGADIAPAMLVGARDRLKDPLFRPVAADGQALPFKSGSFDAVICQLGLQFFPDPACGLAEFYRVLRRGCCAALCVISTPDRAPMWGVVADVLSRFVPEQRDLLYLSFALADANRLEHMFSSAGFRDVRVERVQRGDTISNFDEYWDPIEAGMGSMAQVYVTLSETDRRAARGGKITAVTVLVQRTSYNEYRDVDRGRAGIRTNYFVAHEKSARGRASSWRRIRIYELRRSAPTSAFADGLWRQNSLARANARKRS